VTSTTGRWMILWVQPAIAESKVSGCQHKPSGYISAVTEPDFASAEHPEQSVKCSHTSFSFRSFHFMEKYCHSPSEGLQGPKDSCLLPLDHCCTYSSPIGLCCSGHTLMQGLANILWLSRTVFPQSSTSSVSVQYHLFHEDHPVPHPALLASCEPSSLPFLSTHCDLL
jgi:hypothetical protein